MSKPQFNSKSALLILSLFIFPSAAIADCYSDCMGQCWSSRSDENVSYCSGTAARCSTECRNGGGNRKKYGAIAYSRIDSSFGYSDKWDDQATAEKNAMDACTENGPGCEIIVWFFDSCAAVARGGDVVSFGNDYVEATAKKKALDACVKEGGTKCSVMVWHCSK